MRPSEDSARDSARGPRGPGRLLRPLLAYVGLSLLMFGLPIVGHFGSRIIAADQIDSSAEIWFLSWWPHALLHGINPFVTHAMFYPDGFNLQWATSMPLPAMLTAPITLTLGPVFSWNVLQLAAPALSAWTAYLLCFEVTRRSTPSLVGGYVYGFSPYMLANLTGSPMLALVPLPPLVILLVCRRLRSTIGPRRFALAIGLLLTAQYLTDPEVLVTGTLFGAIAVVLAYAIYPELRARLLETLRWLAAAYAGAIVVLSPFLYYFLFGHHYPPIRTNFSADVAAFLRPPALVALRPQLGSSHPTYAVETYLGLPLIVVAVALAWEQSHRRAVQLTASLLAIVAIASLGGELIVAGHKTWIWMPWRLLQHVPGLRYAIPVRLALFATLAAAVMVAIWLAEQGSRRVAAGRWALAGLAILFIVPNLGNAAWKTNVADPSFFRHDAYRAYLTAADHVLTVPAWGPNERWIADAGFPFPITAGYAAQRFPSGYTQFPTWSTLLTGRLTTDYAAQLRRFVAAKKVTAIVVAQGYPGPWHQLFGTLGIPPIATGGVLLYRLRDGT